MDIHRHNASLFFVPLVEAFHHENRGVFSDDVIDNRVACFKMRLREFLSLAVHPGRKSESVTCANEDKASLGTADLQYGLENLLEGDVGSEHLLPLVLEIQNARDLFEVGKVRWEYNTQIHQGLFEDFCRLRPPRSGGFYVAGDVMHFDSIFSQGDLVAVLQWLLLDSRFVDKRAVRASRS